MNKHRDQELEPMAAEHESPEMAAAEQIISALLEDLLSEARPPDLQNRILSRLDAFDQNKLGLTDEDIDGAVAAAKQEIKDGKVSPVFSSAVEPLFPHADESVSPAQPPPKVTLAPTATDDLSEWIRRGIMVVATLAACLTIAVLWPRGGDPTLDPNGTIASDPSLRNHTDLARIENDSDSDQTLVEAVLKKSRQPKESFPESKISNVDQVAMGTQSSQPSPDLQPKNGTRNNSKNDSRKAAMATQLSDSQIVQLIDMQFDQLWTNAGLKPSPLLEAEDWLSRTSMVLVGRAPTDAEREAYRSLKGNDRDREWVDRWLLGDEFAQHWANKLASHYVGRNIAKSANASPSQHAFVEWLHDSLLKSKFIGDLEFDLLRADSQPESQFAIIDWLERGVGAHASAVLTSGSKQLDGKMAGVAAGGRHLMRLSGNQSLMCTQCHDANKLGSGANNLAESKTELPESANIFWNVAANLSSFELEKSDGREPVIQTSDKTDLFFEDKQGRVQLAKRRPPSISRSVKEQDIAEWFRDSAEPRRSIVDFVWQEVLKQPLVPSFGLDASEGLQDRMDLRSLMASQLQQKRMDVRSLVRLVVLSKVFRLENESIDSQWFLKANENQMADVQSRHRLFATSSIPVQFKSSVGEVPIQRLVAWTEQARGANSGNAALAQPAPSVKKLNPARPNNTNASKPTYTESQLRFLLASEKPYSKASAFAKQIAESKLEWSGALEHAFFMMDSRLPTKGEREESNKLLELMGQDKQRTLIALMIGMMSVE